MRKYITVIIFAALAITLALATFKQVPSGHTGVIAVFGAVSERTLKPGMSVVTPFITRVIEMDNRLKSVEAKADSVSKDLQTIESSVSINYRLVPEQSALMYTSVGQEYENILITPAIQECVKAVTSKYTAEELVTKRQLVGDEMSSLMQEKIRPYGLRVEIFNVVNFSFGDEFNKSVEAKLIAQQSALKAEQDLARIRIEAEQKMVEAEAEAEAYRLKSQQVTENMVMLEAIKKWNGQLPEYWAGEGMVFGLPLR
ncbi:MAG: prohibitin family protein [Eubacteriaceae bacterium]|nr:prohibitin family protein [Eubacteriaceae bacterium]